MRFLHDVILNILVFDYFLLKNFLLSMQTKTIPKNFCVKIYDDRWNKFYSHIKRQFLKHNEFRVNIFFI